MTVEQPLAHRYRETAIKTANPLQLVVILYDGAIRALTMAQEHIRVGDIGGRTSAINSCVAIVTELQASLDFKEGGQIAGSLNRLYDHVKNLVIKANLEQNREPLVEAVTLLENLRSAWAELAARTQNGGAVARRSEATGVNSLNISG